MRKAVEHQFIARIVYVQPSFEELTRRFPSYVEPEYRGNRFDPIERCKAVSKENREVAFEFVCMGHCYASTDEALAEMDRKGLRPALYEELLGFVEKYPAEERKHPVVALGSETNVDGRCLIAVMLGDGGGRYLRLRWVADVWFGAERFLAVRK